MEVRSENRTMPPNEEFQALTDWEKLIEEVQGERRQHKRVVLAFPVEVSGFDRDRRLFCERTFTQDISYTGCRILLKTQVARGDVLAIRLLERGKEGAASERPLLFNVIWAARNNEGWLVGALMLQQEKFWRVDFPDQNKPPTPRS